MLWAAEFISVLLFFSTFYMECQVDGLPCRAVPKTDHSVCF